MPELSVKLHLYLEMKNHETKEEASDRLLRILQKVEFETTGFTSGEFYTTEINKE
jgi:hypothetical protein